ncbi:MAG: chemotaxis protein [Lachnospiraceae bacterium]|nr:chemotaxis protein [Lachnospiraceae bacterium]
MEISDFFDMDILVEILTEWSKATGIAVTVVDENGEYMMKPIGWKDFCMKYTRKTKEGLRRCTKCAQEGQGVYTCHAGLIDFTADIKVGDRFVGKLVGGQVLSKEPDEEYFRNLATELGINPDEYIRALRKVPVKTEEEIRAAANLLENIINMIMNSQYAQKKDSELFIVFDEGVDQASDLIHEINNKSCELDKIEGRQRILGLNASIEAARAGEFGKGFGVVAREVGDLATKSGTINKSIKESLKSLTVAIDKMKEAKEKSVEEEKTEKNQ